MTLTESSKSPPNRLRLFVLACGLVIALGPLFGHAQDATAPPSAPDTTAVDSEPAMPSLWNLAVKGGLFMIPIGLASIVVVAFTLERIIGLRMRKIMPPELLLDLRELNSTNGIDPREAFAICQKHPSPLANALRSSVLKVGRPHAELEKAAEDAVAREAADMSRNFRPINVVATIAPLLGLIGTVQGMIQAFMVLSSLSVTGTEKAQRLAHGIYTALVTTFAGLIVAVVAVMLANFLEGRVDRILRAMEDLFLDLIPQSPELRMTSPVSPAFCSKERLAKPRSGQRVQTNPYWMMQPTRRAGLAACGESWANQITRSTKLPPGKQQS
jgi:biopolymer transport protein ExbB/TolQ